MQKLSSFLFLLPHRINYRTTNLSYITFAIWSLISHNKLRSQIDLFRIQFYGCEEPRWEGNWSRTQRTNSISQSNFAHFRMKFTGHFCRTLSISAPFGRIYIYFFVFIFSTHHPIFIMNFVEQQLLPLHTRPLCSAMNGCESSNSKRKPIHNSNVSKKDM